MLELLYKLQLTQLDVLSTWIWGKLKLTNNSFDQQMMEAVFTSQPGEVFPGFPQDRMWKPSDVFVGF